MQAKPPLACHANLVAEWGGVAAKGREREKRAKRVGVWGGVGWGGQKQTSPLCASKCNNEPPQITSLLYASQLDARNYQRL